MKLGRRQITNTHKQTFNHTYKKYTVYTVYIYYIYGTVYIYIHTLICIYTILLKIEREQNTHGGSTTSDIKQRPSPAGVGEPGGGAACSEAAFVLINSEHTALRCGQGHPARQAGPARCQGREGGGGGGVGVVSTVQTGPQ